ncbi:hypothetical protein LUZ62_029870 [Rhynchospora pubera]|uniref:SMP domain-containing protein n=1 Tax=Rhynchospora pubera TaxID=906938 RepID=A0AAV8HIM1_9POAL|nr:hypothetical protein LUZ62_029870 [Rhynchospora pubera]
MSQDQQRSDQQQHHHNPGEGIKYGDVFRVTGDLAGKTVAPRDASLMQSAENIVLGQTRRTGPAATMQAAAAQNESAGLAAHYQDTDISQEKGVTITETIVPGGRIITEFVAGQAVGQYESPGPGDVASGCPSGGSHGGINNRGAESCGNGDEGNTDSTKITIGEALEAAGQAAQDKLVEQTQQSDAAAIQAAEARAIGLNITMPGGVAAQAQAAVDANVMTTRDEDKTKLGDVLSDVVVKLPADKPVEREDAVKVVGAEIRNKEDARTSPPGVAAIMAAAARLNESAT